MKSLNRAEIIGNLGGDPEMRYTATGKAVTTFTVATSRKYFDDHQALAEETTWHNVVAWEKIAESCNEVLHKGSAVYVSGRISNRSWQDKDKNWHNKSELVADNVIFLEKKLVSEPDESLPREVAPVDAVEGVPVVVKEAPQNTPVESAGDRLIAAAIAAGAKRVTEEAS